MWCVILVWPRRAKEILMSCCEMWGYVALSRTEEHHIDTSSVWMNVPKRLFMTKESGGGFDSTRLREYFTWKGYRFFFCIQILYKKGFFPISYRSIFYYRLLPAAFVHDHGSSNIVNKHSAQIPAQSSSAHPHPAISRVHRQSFRRHDFKLYGAHLL